MFEKGIGLFTEPETMRRKRPGFDSNHEFDSAYFGEC